MKSGLKPIPLWTVVVIGVFQLTVWGWQLQDGGRIKTRWAQDVKPAQKIPLNEYPRPQLRRSAWQNLNGLWQCAMATSFENPPFGRELAGEILVPYPVESALSGVMKEDFSLNQRYIWYRRTFEIPDTWSAKQILLHFEAVDYKAVVYLNGQKLGTHQGGYDAFSFNITPALKPASNELIVGVFDQTNSHDDQPRGKQTNRPNRFHYTATSGIWQTVWLEPVSNCYVTDIKLTPDVKNEQLKLTVHAANASDAEIKALVSGKDYDGRLITGSVGEELSVAIPNPKLWSPASPYLYDLSLIIIKEGEIVDKVNSYFAMRSIEMKRIGKFMRPLLNGKFLFQTGMLDQGFWPDGGYTAPTEEAMKFDIQTQKDLGFNMIRKHVKVEPQRWYYWCDRLGMLVWQDMPHISAGKRGDDFSPAVKSQYEFEFAQMVRQHYNHPSIILWVVFNEGWGAYEYERMTQYARSLDPTRLIDSESGVTAGNARDPYFGDILDNHIYGNSSSYPELYRQVIARTKNPDRIYAVTEYGGGNMEYRVPGHMWLGDPQKDKKPNSCANRPCQECVTAKIMAYNDAVKPLIVQNGLSVLALTQLTDVEIERNGILTYDRAVRKCDFDQLRQKNLEMIAVGNQVNP